MMILVVTISEIPQSFAQAIATDKVRKAGETVTYKVIPDQTVPAGNTFEWHITPGKNGKDWIVDPQKVTGTVRKVLGSDPVILKTVRLEVIWLKAPASGEKYTLSYTECQEQGDGKICSNTKYFDIPVKYYFDVATADAAPQCPNVAVNSDEQSTEFDFVVTQISKSLYYRPHWCFDFKVIATNGDPDDTIDVVITQGENEQTLTPTDGVYHTGIIDTANKVHAKDEVTIKVQLHAKSSKQHNIILEITNAEDVDHHAIDINKNNNIGAELIYAAPNPSNIMAA
ncbi:hypothetical protein EYV94_03265 [Puteibacter caeruleilacunae]|nr:hypothetical protein EYV94_03265 [Puteibacter caeruleilacunae]